MKAANPFSRTLAVIVAASIVMASCQSTTTIQSIPPGAEVYIDGEHKGTAPYQHTDDDIVGSCTSVMLEMEGYKTLNTQFCRDEEIDAGALIGGLLFWIPFLWIFKYQDAHVYELAPTSEGPDDLKYFVPQDTGHSKPIDDIRTGLNNLKDRLRENSAEEEDQEFSLKAKKLRELKALHEEGVLTDEEYQKEKKKILEEE